MIEPISIKTFITRERLAPLASCSACSPAVPDAVPGALIAKGPKDDGVWQMGDYVVFCDANRELWVAINSVKQNFRVHRDSRTYEGNLNALHTELLSF